MIESWQAYAPNLIDDNAQIVVLAINQTFTISPIMLADCNASDMQNLPNMMREKLQQAKISHSSQITNLTNFRDQLSRTAAVGPISRERLTWKPLDPAIRH